MKYSSMVKQGNNARGDLRIPLLFECVLVEYWSWYVAVIVCNTGPVTVRLRYLWGLYNNWVHIVLDLIII